MNNSFINGFKTAITFIALFLIFLVEGCMNWVEVGFLWDNLLQPQLYILTGLNATLMIAIKIIVFNWLLPLIKEKNKTLKKEQIKNSKLSEFKDLKFYGWIESNYNINSKKEAWRIKISKKLRKLNKWAKDKEVAEYYKIKREAYILSDDEQNLKFEPVLNKYGQKRERLELQITEEYINDNIEFLNVNYHHINPYDFDIPVTNDRINKNKITSHETRAIALSLVLSCIVMLVLNMIKQLLDPNPNNAAFIATIINLGLDLLFMAWQCFSAFLDANKIVKKELIVAYANRNRILIEYIYFKNANNIDEVKSRVNTIEADARKEAEGA